MNRKQGRNLSRIDGVGISTSALDMMFCALGATMLLFAMQERAEFESTRSEEFEKQLSSLQRITEAVNAETARQPTNWPGVQSLPALNGDVIFVLDQSGSLTNDDQRRAQRHLVSQYVLQNRIDDFAVVLFAGKAVPIVLFGKWNEANWTEQVGASNSAKHKLDVTAKSQAYKRRLENAGIPKVELNRLGGSDTLTKLASFDVVSEHKLKTPIGGGTAIDAALTAFVKLAAGRATKPSIVLISDGQAGGRGTPPYFAEPNRLAPLVEKRIAISLVNSSDGSSFHKGTLAMQKFTEGADGHHILIHGYGRIPESQVTPSVTEDASTKPDLPLQGAAQ